MTVLRQALATLNPTDGCGSWLQQLVQQRLDQLPLPGAGHTLQRWQALADVAAYDLSLAKLFEGHTDALAILRELDAQHVLDRIAAPDRTCWAVWASEAPPGRVTLHVWPLSNVTGMKRLTTPLGFVAVRPAISRNEWPALALTL